MLKRQIAPLVILLFACQSSVGASADDANTLGRLIDRAQDGEAVVIPEGRYDIADFKLRADVNLVGDGEVVFYSSRPTAKGLLNPLNGVSLRIENITMEGARSPDLNGAGIRHEGEDLTIVNCRFIDNDDGILATGSKTGVILIEDSSFIGNGHGDGYSHGIYVLYGERLEITGSRFVGTNIGHHVKSLAKATILTGNEFDDADGRTSYSLDASGGGLVTVIGNRFVQAADGDNPTLINYDLTRGGEALGLTISDNTIINYNPNGRLLRNDTNLKATLQNNVISNEGRGRMKDGVSLWPF